MNTLKNYIEEYIEYCEYRKRLDTKTLKAYRIDLKQYENFCSDSSAAFSRDTVDSFITHLHRQYKPKTVRRKIASLKAFFHYLEYKEALHENPFLNWISAFARPNSCRKPFPFTRSRHFFPLFTPRKNKRRPIILSGAVSGILR